MRSTECQQNLLHYQTPPLPPALNAALIKSSNMRGGATRQKIEIFHLARVPYLAALTSNRMIIAAVGILKGRTSLLRLKNVSRFSPNLSWDDFFHSIKRGLSVRQA